jgi:predicted RNA-binding Zn-ribbon protein involved in translation (DUF1610 family)
MSETEFTEENIGKIVTITTIGGTEIDSEIVRVYCPACGEEFIGSKRQAGGFIAGHQSYHEFVNAQDLILTSMGGR